jgi:hypothetical protein
VGVLERQRQRAGTRWDNEQVDVVGHLNEECGKQGNVPSVPGFPQQLEAAQPAMLAQQVEVDQPVGIAFENGLAGVAALGDMVWRINCHHACESGHDT